MRGHDDSRLLCLCHSGETVHNLGARLDAIDLVDTLARLPEGVVILKRRALIL